MLRGSFVTIYTQKRRKTENKVSEHQCQEVRKEQKIDLKKRRK